MFVKEVGATTLSAYSGTAGATVVYEGAIDPTAGTEVVIPFSQPYVYQGGNLLIGCYNTAKGTYQSCKFMGKTLEIGVSAYGSSSSSLDEASFNRTAFLPKTTFSYTAAVYGKPKSRLCNSQPEPDRRQRQPDCAGHSGCHIGQLR